MDALRQVTVGMLVNHTSGIDGEILPDFGPDRERIVDAIPRFQDMGQIHAPGADLSYCNTATVLAGYLCQELKEESWYTLVEKQIFEPLEMEHSAVQPVKQMLHRHSTGHYIDAETGEAYRSSQQFLPLSFAPAGATAKHGRTNT